MPLALTRSDSSTALFDRCADLITQADGLLITAGAGLGVDSGLPDFRGDHGMWRAYPALGRAGMGFADIANPATFHDDPALAWGFYGHRLALYRATTPGPAFAILRAIAARMPHGSYVFTSNVDGQFQKAGFDPTRIVECHGSIHHLQCLTPCTRDTWPADDFTPVVDAHACQLVSPLPRCPHCGGIARPQIYLFGDHGWQHDKTGADEERLEAWLQTVQRPLVIELGAGTRIPSARHFGEHHAWRLIRINPREAHVRGTDDLALPMGASEAMAGINDALARRPAQST